MKKCPYCAEEIQDAAIVCKHCGKDLFKPTIDQAKIAGIENEINRLQDQRRELVSKRDNASKSGNISALVMVICLLLGFVIHFGFFLLVLPGLLGWITQATKAGNYGSQVDDINLQIEKQREHLKKAHAGG